MTGDLLNEPGIDDEFVDSGVRFVFDLSDLTDDEEALLTDLQRLVNVRRVAFGKKPLGNIDSETKI